MVLDEDIVGFGPLGSSRLMHLKVLVVGHGAREYAIAKKLAESDVELHAARARAGFS